MDLADIANLRLASQQIAGTTFKAVKDLVGWMGAIQAQDLAMAKWAVGVRLPGSTVQEIEAAVNSGEIIRTHLLRPTWHIVSADDIYWMLALSAPQIRTSLKSRHKDLGLSAAVIAKSNQVIEKALREAQFLPREALSAALEKADIPVGDNRTSHLLLQAELDGIICSGGTIGNKQTYALLEERVPRPKPVLTKDEALATLASKYFASHGPATLPDFVWWSGLSVLDAKHALEMVNSVLASATIASQTYWYADFIPMPANDPGTVHVLPAFDELIISYKDRSASIPPEIHAKAVSENGIFRPVIVVHGKVSGLWKRTIKKDKVVVETELFNQPDKRTKRQIEEAFEPYGRFLEKKIEISHRY